MRVADLHVEVGRGGSGAAELETLPLPPSRTSRLLAGRFDFDGENRIATLQQRELEGRGAAWRPASTRWPPLVAALLWAVGLLGWWAFCARTFGWGAERSTGREEPARHALEETERRQPDDEELLRIVAQHRIPSWRLGAALRRNLRSGLVDNRDGLRLTPTGEDAVRALGPVAISPPSPQGPGQPPATGEGQPALATGGAIPSWAYLVVAAPVAIWLLGQPALLANVALWTTTLLSASRMGNRSA